MFCTIFNFQTRSNIFLRISKNFSIIINVSNLLLSLFHKKSPSLGVSTIIFWRPGLPGISKEISPVYHFFPQNASAFLLHPLRLFAKNFQIPFSTPPACISRLRTLLNEVRPPQACVTGCPDGYTLF